MDNEAPLKSTFEEKTFCMRSCRGIIFNYLYIKTKQPSSGTLVVYLYLIVHE